MYQCILYNILSKSTHYGPLTDAFYCVAGEDGATFDCFLQVNVVVPRGKAHSSGYRINLRGHGMNNVTGKKKRSDTQIYDFIVIERRLKGKCLWWNS